MGQVPGHVASAAVTVPWLRLADACGDVCADAWLWQAIGVRTREFWLLVDEVFGPGMGRALVREQVLAALDNRTPAQAMDAGVPLRNIWHALCDAMDVPDSQRWGLDIERQAPPRRR